MAKLVGSRMASTVVHTEPISTMNMTGFLWSVAGFSFVTASGSDRSICLGSSRPPGTRRGPSAAAGGSGAPGPTGVLSSVVKGYIIQSGDGTYAREPNLTLDKMGMGGPDWKVQDDKVTTAYKRGTVSLARTSAVNSGNSQFFIVLDDSAQSSLGAATANTYAIFGSVTTGMDVVDRIASVPVGGEPDSQGNPATMPLQPIVITSTIVTTP